MGQLLTKLFYSNEICYSNKLKKKKKKLSRLETIEMKQYTVLLPNFMMH